MSAERLRQAATLLRERAEAATPGPWKSWGMDLLADPVGNSNVDDGIPVIRGLVPSGERLRTHNIDYVQTMQPRVALALADLLQMIAQDVGTSSLAFHRANALADAILGATR